MSKRFAEAFVDKLILLEQKAGADVGYRVMPPFTEPFHDYLSIQKTAKDIAVSIGLTDYTFVVSVVKQKQKVGGHIDLSTEGTVVFIEIDPEVMKFPDSVGATLCHEICHKWLQRNGIRSLLEIDNEILTDITSVFLGFGKIMLNGCMTYNVRHETQLIGTQAITETMRVGYLDRDQLAFVYCLICSMRKIPSSDYLKGLNHEAIQAIRNCTSTFGHYLEPRFHQIEQSQETVDGFVSKVTKVQYTLAELDKYASYVRSSFCDTVNAFLKTGHKELESLKEKTYDLSNETSPDPALRFLQAIKVQCAINRLLEQVPSVSKEADELILHAREIGRHLKENPSCFPPPSPSMFNIVVCPKDGTKLRLPENSGDLLVTCPKCKFHFGYNTSTVSFSGTAVSHKMGWWSKVRRMITRKLND